MSCCNNKNKEKQYNAESQSTCLVMGNPVDKKRAEENGLFRDYSGERYYFCCNGCPEKFDKDPEKYLSQTSASRGKEGCC